MYYTNTLSYEISNHSSRTAQYYYISIKNIFNLNILNSYYIAIFRRSKKIGFKIIYELYIFVTKIFWASKRSRLMINPPYLFYYYEYKKMLVNVINLSFELKY